MKQFMSIVLGAALLLTACSQQNPEVPASAPTSDPATASAPQSAMAASEPASVLYADANFQGSKQELSVGTYNTGQLFGNDQLTSLRVMPGFRVTLCANKDFGGASRIYTQDCPNVGSDFNDKTSSVRVERLSPLPGAEVNDGGPAAVLYGDADLQGEKQELTLGSYNTTQLFGNDKLTSLRVLPGVRVTLYEHKDFGGASRTFTQDCLNVGSGFNDKTSSVRVEAVSPLDGTEVEADLTKPADLSYLLTLYAPQIWLAKAEPHMPSSVEWNSAHVERYLPTDDNRYMLRTKEPLASPSTKLPYFAGNLASAKVYAFAIPKTYNNLDLCYYTFYPYNLGKDVLNTNFGDHVGDWEHLTVRLASFAYQGRTYVKPTLVYFPAHSFGSGYAWSEVPKVSSTHPVGYSAKGSHGIWKDAGNHIYQNIPILGDLVDECSEGTVWETWTVLEKYTYSAQAATGTALEGNWPSWLNKDYSSPDSQAVYRWGNQKQGPVFGQYRLVDGPTGPQEKTTHVDLETLG